MARKKKSRHFSDRVLDKYIEKNKNEITRGYIESGGRKDKRSKKATRTDEKRAVELFKRTVKGKFDSDNKLTTAEAIKKVKRTRLFTSQEEIGKQNMANTLKKFGYFVSPKDLKWDNTINTYKVINGKYAGKYVVMVHRPGQNPSYVYILQ